MYTEISKQHWRLKGKAPGINLMLGAFVASKVLGTPLRYDDFLFSLVD
jgi:hypothetical protein